MAFMRKTKLSAAVAVLAVTVGLRMASGFAKDAEPAQTLHGPPAPRYWPAAATQPSSTQPVDIPETHMHTPAQTMAMTRLPPGYRLELVASEPDLISPVCLAWDGDGRMYVAEMRSYMLDLDAHHEKDPISRVSMWQSTHGDGHYDRHTVFIDNLILPRMILPLDDRILVRMTDDPNIYSYRDTHNTGAADEKKLMFQGPPPKNQENLEHQASSLMWDIDNWIYQTHEKERFRYVNGKLEGNPLPINPGQWGMAIDDTGRIIYNTAGAERPAHNFQVMPQYANIELPGELSDDFMEVYPILPTTDMQGGLRRVKAGGGLSHFTGCAGGCIFRGDALPHDLYGDYILPEPVGRLIRRAKVQDIDGKIVISNAYHQQEFIASMDANFRPVWTATGPDGCMYICDMYHGIIQESHWTMEDSFLRPQILKYGLQKNINAGRIYRLVYDDMPRRSTPHMLEETPAQLVQHLSDPNGWWRDTAQKLIIVRGDKSIVPTLRSMAEHDSNPITRLHALWTVDGLNSIDSELLIERLQDTDPRVRCAAIRIAEPLMVKNDPKVMAAIKPLGMDSDAGVAEQLCVSLIYTKNPQAQSLIKGFFAAREKAQLALANPKLVVKKYEDELAKAAEAERKQKELEKQNAGLAAIVAQGRANYLQTCIACHGVDGKGAPTPDKIGTLAPPLVGSKRLTASPELVGRIVLHGLVGPHDNGKMYPNEMASFAWADDVWLSSILTYARQEWGNSAPPITPQQLARVREETAKRVKPFTVAELATMHFPASRAATRPSTTQLATPTTKTAAVTPRLGP